MIPIEKIKAYLDIEGNEHDALLFIILERTVDLAENFLSSPLERREIVRFKDCYRSVIFLDEVEPVVLKVEAIRDGETEELSFEQHGREVIIRSVCRNDRVKVTMQAGWSELPPSLEFAIIKEVAYEFLKSHQGEGRLGKTSSGDSLGGRALSTSYSESEFVREIQRWRTR